MADMRSMLQERAVAFEPMRDGIEDLRRRRRRRAARTRATALGVGLAVAAAAVLAGWRLASLEPADSEPAEITPATASTLEQLWTVRDGDVVGVVAGERYVVAAERDGTLRALDPITGSEVWSARTGAPAASAPAAGSGVVAIQGTDGVLRAFPERCEEEPCVPLWTSRTGARSARPAIADGVVAITSERGALSVFALACSDPCRPLWTAEVGGLESLQRWLDRSFLLWPRDPRPVPAIGGGYVWDSSDGVLRVFPLDCEATDGRCEPATEIRAGRGARFTSSPAVGRDRVFVAGSGSLHAYELGCPVSGACIPAWRAAVGTLTTTTPGVAGDIVVVHANYTGALYTFPVDCVAPDGLCTDPRWVSAPGRTPYGDPLVSDDVVFASSTETGSEVFPLACRTDPCESVFSLPGAVASIDVWGGRVLVLVSPEGDLRALAPGRGP